MIENFRNSILINSNILKERLDGVFKLTKGCVVCIFGSAATDSDITKFLMNQ